MLLSHWQRLIAYLSGCLVIGLALVVFTHIFFKFANTPGTAGYITLFAFGFAYLNLGFAINRRFILKSDHNLAFNYLFSFMMVGPTLLWIFTKDTGLQSSLLTFTLTICFAAFLGTYFGIHRGFSKRAYYWDTHPKYEEEDELPEELKRPHDKVSNN